MSVFQTPPCRPAGLTSWMWTGLATCLVLCVAWGAQFVADVKAIDQPDPFEAGLHAVNGESGRARVDVDAVGLKDESKTEAIKRAHHEVDSNLDPGDSIQQVAWPWSNGPDQIGLSGESEPRRGLFAKPNKTIRPRDPFAENQDSPTGSPEKSFTKSTDAVHTSRDSAQPQPAVTNRQRLIEYQSRANKPVHTSIRSNSPATLPATPKEPVESPVMTISMPHSIASPQTEEQLRAMFETTIDPQLPPKQTPSPPVPTSAESPLNAIAAIETKEPEVPESAANRPVTEVQTETELPLETLQFRARQAQEKGRLESARQLRLAAEKSNVSRQPLPVQPLKAKQSSIHQLVSAPSESGRARVDQIRDEVEATSEPGAVGIAVLANEPIIRPAHRSNEMPAPQVLANRAIQLPAPAGWSAATKIEANRRENKISSTAVTDAASRVSTVISNHGIQSAIGEHNVALTDRRPVRANQGQPLQQPVSLGRIEDEIAVQLLSNQDDVIGNLQDASYSNESQTSVREPARIPASELAPNPEPISEPLLTSAQPPRWLMYAIAAAGVLFGLYGMSRSHKPGRKISM